MCGFLAAYLFPGQMDSISHATMAVGIPLISDIPSESPKTKAKSAEKAKKKEQPKLSPKLSKEQEMESLQRMKEISQAALRGIPFQSPFENHLKDLYRACDLDRNDLSFQTFKLGMIGYYNLLKKSKLKRTGILSIVDYDKPSSEERLYIIDLKGKRLLDRLLVAHGQRSGWNYAKEFSDTPQSHQTSLGFYKTAETYSGKYGYSLRLDGFEKGFNAKARSRAVVMHGAGYVSRDYLKQHGRLGRSWGCLTLTMEESEKTIRKIKGGTCIYVHGPSKDYQKKSKLLDVEAAWEVASRDIKEEML